MANTSVVLPPQPDSNGSITFSGLITGTGIAVTGSSAAAVGNGLYLTAANTPGLASNGTLGYFMASDQRSVFGVSTGTAIYANRRIHARGFGTTAATYSLALDNSDGSKYLQFGDAGLLEVLGNFSFAGSNPTFQGTSGTLSIGNLTSNTAGLIQFPSANTGAIAFTAATGTLTNNAFTFAGGPTGFVAGNGGFGAINTLTGVSSALSGATSTLIQIPAGSLVLGVTARVTTAITSGVATSWSLGTVATPTLWGTTLAFTLGTTVTGTNYVLFTAPIMYPTATNIIATANAGTFSAGVVRVQVYYMNYTAPTS